MTQLESFKIKRPRNQIGIYSESCDSPINQQEQTKTQDTVGEDEKVEHNKENCKIQ